MALVQCMGLLSISPTVHHCCLYHASAQRLREQLRRIQGRPCLAHFKPQSDTQCPDCGVLVPLGPSGSRICFACEEDISKPEAGPHISL